MSNYMRNKQILNLVIYKLISNNIKFCFEPNKLEVQGHFRLSVYQEGEVEIVTNNYPKDFKFLNDVSDGFILDIVDRVIFKY